jgi:hypothetical protein
MKKQVAKWIFIACTCLALLGGWATLSMERVPRDARGCPENWEPSAVTVILLDQSDALSASDERRLDLIEDEVLKNASPDTLVLVTTLEDSEENPVKGVGGLCISPEPKQSGDLPDYLTGNPRQRHKRWTVQVRDRLRQLLKDGMREAAPQSISPISQALFVIAREPEFESAKSRRIIVVSDMLEHTRRFSLVKPTGKRINAALAQKPSWNGSLKWFEVLVFLAHRQDKNVQSTQRFRAYWSAFADRTGVQSWKWH